MDNDTRKMTLSKLEQIPEKINQLIKNHKMENETLIKANTELLSLVIPYLKDKLWRKISLKDLGIITLEYKRVDLEIYIKNYLRENLSKWLYEILPSLNYDNFGCRNDYDQEKIVFSLKDKDYYQEVYEKVSSLKNETEFYEYSSKLNNKINNVAKVTVLVSELKIGKILIAKDFRFSFEICQASDYIKNNEISYLLNYFQLFIKYNNLPALKEKENIKFKQVRIESPQKLNAIYFDSRLVLAANYQKEWRKHFLSYIQKNASKILIDKIKDFEIKLSWSGNTRFDKSGSLFVMYEIAYGKVKLFISYKNTKIDLIDDEETFLIAS